MLRCQCTTKGEIGLTSGRSTSLLRSAPALTFPSGVGSVRSLFAGASKGEGGERARLVRKRGLKRSLAGVRSREGTAKTPHNRRMGEGPNDSERRDE